MRDRLIHGYVDVTKLKEIRNEISDVAKAAHDLSQQLHPSVLSQLGLKTALEAECASYSRQHGMIVDFSAQSISEQLPDSVALCLYHLAQESLENIRRHAKTKKASVTLAGKGDEIVIVIRDFGRGFDLEAARTRGGLGLISMEERVRLLDGSVSVTSEPADGTQVEVHIPLEN